MAISLLTALPLHAQAIPSSGTEQFRTGSNRPAEGVHVSGRWTIRVFDSEGRKKGTRIFENELAPEGNDTLVQLLQPGVETAKWLVIVHGPDDASHPCLGGGDCFLFSSSDLEVETIGSDLGSYVLRLEGVVTPSNDDGIISAVETQMGTSLTPDVVGRFTYKDLGIDAIDVNSGDMVVVRVEISFN